MKQTSLVTLNDIPKFAKQLANTLKGGEILALIGPLGAGKTTFAKALGKELNIKHKITSPTFTLMHSFAAKLKQGKPATLYHLDLYRTKNFREAKALGLNEFWGQPRTVTLIEWADKIGRHLPKKTKKIIFTGHEK
ncbi:MAG: tRNA (adenosine(37)-N6)-threonylcarbamoyltransferase complex ATPase subunit type 1 TsaE [Candidatus Doudnabacteria bacterium]|nr:tRNA (adenosine(37)-N6)-threonylcarbamoyltransferase complex ATPase subunit type 1 TsaE [Candidatus Doudnabacteria bacterium]